jgi:hypothetical protein
MIFAFEAPSGNIARVIVLIVGPRIGASINWRDPDPSQVDIAAADAYVIARIKRHLEEQGQKLELFNRPPAISELERKKHGSPPCGSTWAEVLDEHPGLDHGDRPPLNG